MVGVTLLVTHQNHIVTVGWQCQTEWGAGPKKSNISLRRKLITGWSFSPHDQKALGVKSIVRLASGGGGVCVCVVCVCVEDPFCVSELLIFLSSLRLVLGQMELALQKGLTSMMTAKKNFRKG